MSKVILVQPKCTGNIVYIPLGLLHLATILNNNGYEVKIIDTNFEKNYLKLFSKELKDALLVGITVNTSQVKDALEISMAIKSLSSVPIVWGGWHPTLFPEQTNSDNLVDFVIVNEGEFTLLELVNALESKREFSNIKGLVYKENGNINVNLPREYLNIENLPPIKYELCDLSKYFDVSFKGRITYQSSRGCPYRCRFCINVVTKNQKYRMKSPEKVLDELEELIKKYNINFVHFVDDNFFLDINRVKAICKGIIQRNLKINWFGECRADYFREGFVDEDFLRLAQKSGLTKLTIGAESGSSKMLKLMDKHITVDNIINSAKILGKFDIVPDYGFIIGLPGESKEDVVTTLKLIENLKTLCPQMMHGINTFRTYPRCELTNSLIKEGLIKEPKTLREWTKEENLKLYIGNNKQVWQFDPNFVYYVSYFTEVGYDVYKDKEIKNILRYFIIYKFMDILFIYSARFRLKYLFLSFPIDRYLYKVYKNIFVKLKQIIRSSNLEAKIRLFFRDFQ